MSTPSASRSERGLRLPLTALSEQAEGALVHVAGRVLTGRDGHHSLEDASGRAVAKLDANLPPGTLCSVWGTWRDGVVHAERVEVHGGGEHVFRPGSDYSRLHAGGAAPLHWLHERARLVRAVRSFFDSRGYLEVETPAAVPSPGLDLHLAAFELSGTARPRFLITSPEYQMKRLLSAGAERIYQVARCFRGDEAGPHHEPEFSMLEWYRAHADMASMLDETEALVRAVTGVAQAGHAPGPRSLCTAAEPFERLTVREAFGRYADRDADALARSPDAFFRVLVEQVEPQLGRERPTFLTHYPASMASLARLCPEDPTVAERFELYVDGVELCNGFGELTCPDEQRQRLKADQRARRDAGLPVYPIDERFLDALRDGMPPSTGNALGLDRLFMLALGLDDIQSLATFPDATL